MFFNPIVYLLTKVKSPNSQDSWGEEKKNQRKYSSIFIGYFGFNEASTNILHLTSHVYSNIDLEIEE